MEILNVNYAEIKLKTESTSSLIALFPRDIENSHVVVFGEAP